MSESQNKDAGVQSGSQGDSDQDRWPVNSKHMARLETTLADAEKTLQKFSKAAEIETETLHKPFTR